MKKISIFLYYFISIFYLEILFKILLEINIFKFTTISMIIFITIVSAILAILSKLFSNKVNKIISYIIISFLCIWIGAQYVVKDVFSFYIDLALLTGAGTQVAQGVFLSETIKQIFARTFFIILILLPIVIKIIFKKYFNYNRYKKSKIFVFLFIAVIGLGIYNLSLLVGKNKTYSAYKLKYEIWNTELTIEKLGVFNSLYFDNYKTLINFEEKIIINTDVNSKKKKKEKEEKVYKYNNLDIDFETLINNSSDSTIKTMSQYFFNETGTLQNDYTGYFKNKNLIMFMAESFNEIAVDEVLTPTLYKLVNNGFVFKDFYSPTIFSTIGGEMQELTGLYPSAYGVFKEGTTSYPMGLGKLFKDNGYETFAYHDHTYSFQNRYKYLKALGFDNFKGCYNGLEQLIDCNLWPESDIEMIDKTFEEYANSTNPFMVFYATVSGHGSWSWNNQTSKKYREDVESLNLGYPEAIEAYIASQVELDKALELLIQKLDDKGILEDTVIVLVGDHYPYMLTEGASTDQIEFFTKTLGKDLIIGVNESNLIIYNSEMNKVNVEKTGSQIDVLPTVYNLFGLPYDSRLIIGKDILSTEDGVAIFGNRSWATNKGRYYSSTGRFVPYNEEEVEEEYVNTMNQIVNNRINMSKLIMDKNYYKTVWQYVKNNTETE